MNFTRELKYPKPKGDTSKGDFMTGADVLEVQTILIGAHYNIGKKGADSDYGPDTVEAVKLFQHAHRDERGKALQPDGVVGEHTWWALLNLPGQAISTDIQAFTDYAAAQVGCLYVSGAQGQTMTANLIRQLEKDDSNYKRAIAMFNKHVAAGTSLIGYDCSGLVMAYIENKVHLVSSDRTANGIFYDLCTAISNTDLQAGDLVFMKNLTNSKMHHVGIYMGDGTVIESRGRDYGVVRTILSQRSWNRFGRLKCFAQKAC